MVFSPVAEATKLRKAPAIPTVDAPAAVTAVVTYAVVANFVLLSPVVWVAAVVPLGSAGVPERLAAVPVVD